jgi:multidrug efflux system membrane fusion protein
VPFLTTGAQLRHLNLASYDRPDNGNHSPQGDVPNADERLWPGEFVNMRVILNMRKDVPTVPAQTVQEGPNGHYAYVIRKDDTVERRPVEVAALQGSLAVIAKGLSPGEKVVVDGQYRLTDGARVRPLAESAGEG